MTFFISSYVNVLIRMEIRYSGEYLLLSKRYSSSLMVTSAPSWILFASVNDFTNMLVNQLRLY